MRITATVLTHNTATNGRERLLRDAVASLAEADMVIVVDNSSTDDTPALIQSLDVAYYLADDSVTTCGHGTNLCARVAIGAPRTNLCVLSDEDMWWRPGWADQLRAWWSEAPLEVALTGCHLEPEFPWNAITGTVTYGGVTGLLRESTGAASWSFRSNTWGGIGPVPEKVQGVGDVPTCEKVRRAGRLIAQLDLAEHRGQGASTWGNRTDELYGWDLEPVKARIA